ncbi:hypothetical protein U1Q18_006305 [Sarracenia purpurea var. burkii]
MATGGDHHNNLKIDNYPENSRYLIVRPENGGIRDLFRFLISPDREIAAKFIESSDGDVVREELKAGGDDGDDSGATPAHRWVIFVSIIVRKILSLLSKPMEWTGYVFEFFLNLLSDNGNLLHLLYNLLRGNSCISTSYCICMP